MHGCRSTSQSRHGVQAVLALSLQFASPWSPGSKAGRQGRLGPGHSQTVLAHPFPLSPFCYSVPLTPVRPLVQQNPSPVPILRALSNRSSLLFPVCLALLLLSSRTLPRPLSASFSIPPAHIPHTLTRSTHFYHPPSTYLSNLSHISIHSEYLISVLPTSDEPHITTLYQFSHVQERKPTFQKNKTYYIRTWRCTTNNQTSRALTFALLCTQFLQILFT